AKESDSIVAVRGRALGDIISKTRSLPSAESAALGNHQRALVEAPCPDEPASDCSNAATGHAGSRFGTPPRMQKTSFEPFADPERGTHVSTMPMPVSCVPLGRVPPRWGILTSNAGASLGRRQRSGAASLGPVSYWPIQPTCFSLRGAHECTPRCQVAQAPA